MLNQETQKMLFHAWKQYLVEVTTRDNGLTFNAIAIDLVTFGNDGSYSLIWENKGESLLLLENIDFKFDIDDHCVGDVTDEPFFASRSVWKPHEIENTHDRPARMNTHS